MQILCVCTCCTHTGGGYGTTHQSVIDYVGGKTQMEESEKISTKPDDWIHHWTGQGFRLKISSLKWNWCQLFSLLLDSFCATARDKRTTFNVEARSKPCNADALGLDERHVRWKIVLMKRKGKRRHVVYAINYTLGEDLYIILFLLLYWIFSIVSYALLSHLPATSWRINRNQK